MEKEYRKPLMEVIEIDINDDIITTSGDPDGLFNQEADPWYQD